MTVEDVKKAIERQTGIPVNILTADTETGIIAQARSILAYKQEQEKQRPKDMKEQFAEWARDLLGIEESDMASVLDDIAEAVRVDAGGYPRVRDGGQVSIDGMPDPRPTAAQFEEWFQNKTAFDPRKSRDAKW